MKRDNILNMTTGSPIRLIVLFAIPLLIGNLFQQVYSLTDSIIVGQFLGAHALAAVGATGSVTFLFFSVCNGISSAPVSSHPSSLGRMTRKRQSRPLPIPPM